MRGEYANATRHQRGLAYALNILCLITAAGCSSLPVILPSPVPDLARTSGRPVKMESVNGPLSAAKTRAVLETLKRPGHDTNMLERHLALEEAIAGGPLSTGNEVRLLQDGPATYKAMLAAIQAAKNHINLETYILDDDKIGRQFAQALIAKQLQGVQVNIIRDSVGTLNTPAAFFKSMSDSGIRILEFNPINPLAVRKNWAINQRDHRKLLIVDGHIAFLGGINISSVYSGGSFSRSKHPKSPSDAEDTGESAIAWRDTDLQVRGPVVADFQKLFIATWESQKGDPLPTKNYYPAPQSVGRHIVRAIGSSPDESFSRIYATLLSAIGSAEASVSITNAYFAPDPQLLTALEAAAQRGVAVTLILPSRTDSWLIFHAGRAYYQRLLHAGVKIYERQGVILHAKTALVDGVWATIGSTNLDWRSFLHNYELNAVVLGTEFGNQVQAMFDKDLAQSHAIELVAWKNRHLQFHIQEWFAGLWEYWL